MGATRIPANTRDIRSLDWLRMPLALCVIFIHSFGTKSVNYDLFRSDPGSWEAIYNGVRIFFSHQFPTFAVPTFFLISGYLFFRHLEHWQWSAYSNKLQRRIHTILLPYIGWNIFHCIHLCWPLLMKIVHGTAHWDALWRMIRALGGWHMLWVGSYHTQVANILGITMPFAAPVLVPLWFLRDLMVIILFAPAIHWLLSRFGRWFIALLGACYLLKIWIPLPGFSIHGTFWFALGGYFTLHGCNMVDWFFRRRWCFWSVWPLMMAAGMVLALFRPDTPAYWSGVLKASTTLFSVPAVVAIAASIQHVGLLRDRPWLAHSAFWVYCSHIFMRKMVLNITTPLVPHTYAAYTLHYILVPFLTLLLCLIVRQLWLRIRKGLSACC